MNTEFESTRKVAPRLTLSYYFEICADRLKKRTIFLSRMAFLGEKFVPRPLPPSLNKKMVAEHLTLETVGPASAVSCRTLTNTAVTSGRILLLLLIHV
jgi:hypothetical protein